MITGNSTIALVEVFRNAISTEHYEDRVDMVFQVMRRGSFTRSHHGHCYGSDDHLAGLAELEKQIQTVRAEIVEQRRRDRHKEARGVRKARGSKETSPRQVEEKA